MFGLDEYLAGLGGGSWAMVLVVAALLGLRHATDPDHLTAVAALVLDDARGGARRARGLGVAWGLGHAATLVAFGLPVILVGHAFPDLVFQIAELAVGAVIILLSARLLVRWRRGAFHAHAHSHAGSRHAHPHVHEEPRPHPHPHPQEHDHAHAETLGWSPRAAFGIGLIHGVGGSGGLGILVAAAASDRAQGVLALLLFALGTAASMTLVTAGVGSALGLRTTRRRLEAAIPGLAVLSLSFGAWYAAGALPIGG